MAKFPPLKHHLEFFTPHSMCPHCLGYLDNILPVEPLYDLAVAAEIIPLTYKSLYSRLGQMQFEKRYRKGRAGPGGNGSRHRMLTAREIRTIRGAVLVFKNADGTFRDPNPDGS